MTTAQGIVGQLNARRIRDDEFRARCPVHRGNSNTSLSITVADDRILIHCWQGCSIEEITAAIGLQVSDLFIESRTDSSERIAAERQRQIRDGFKSWRDMETLRSAGELRSRDQARLAIDGDVTAGTITKDVALEKLASLYTAYCELEYRFDTLLSGTDAEALEIFRGH